MSAADFKGAVYAFQRFMQDAQREIDTGARKGADRRYATADGRQRLTWQARAKALQARRLWRQA